MMLGSRSKSVDLIPEAERQTSGRRGSRCFKKKLLRWTDSISNNGRKTSKNRSVFYISDLDYQGRKTRSSVINLLSAADISVSQFTDSKSSTDMSNSSSARNCSMSSNDLNHAPTSRNCSKPSNKTLPRNVMSISTLSNQTLSNIESQPLPDMESRLSPNMESLLSLLSPPDDDMRGNQSTSGLDQTEQGEPNKGGRDISPHPFTYINPITPPNVLTSPPALPPFPPHPSGSISHHCMGTKMRVIRRNVHHKFLRFRSRSVDRLWLDDEEAREVMVRPTRRRTVIAGGEGGEDGDCGDGALIGEAVALVDYVPSPYDKTALSFKRGDKIQVLAMNPSGLWKGRCGGRVGNFKFINVRTVPERIRRLDMNSGHLTVDWSTTLSVNNLLTAIRMEQLTSVFVLNGFDTLEDVKNLNEDDLEYLGINDMEDKVVILEAIAQVRVSMAGEGVEDTASWNSETSVDFSNKLRHGSRTSCSSDSDKSSKTESGFHSTDDSDHCDENYSSENDMFELSAGLENMKMIRNDNHKNVVKWDVDSVPRSFLYRSKHLNVLNKVEGSFSEGMAKTKGDVLSRPGDFVDSQRL